MSTTKSRFILHIEDDEDDRQMLKDAVKEIDPSIDVRSATTGSEGLELLLQGSLVNQLPEQIILDLNLPGMDGKIVLKEIKKQNHLSGIPVVILTTSSSDLDRMFAAKEGVKLFTKPSSEADFFVMVKEIIGSSVRIKQR